MVARYEFIERTLHLIRKLLETYLPEKATLEEMVEKRNKLLQKFMK
jgi:hypothetical protein